MAGGDLREAFRQFTTTVGLITTHSSKGPNVMACEWTYNVSYEPFLISVHIDPTEATHEAIVETGEFGVNLVAEDQVVAMGFAGHFSQREIEKLSSTLFETYPAKRIGAPMIKGAILNVECRLYQRILLGDHTAFVGEVVEFSVDRSKRPVVFHRGARRLGFRIRRPVSVVVAVAPRKAKLGSGVKVAGELTAPNRASKPIRLILRDPDGKDVVEARAVTGEDGQFSAEVVIPEGGATGPYSLVGRYRGVEGKAFLNIE